MKKIKLFHTVAMAAFLAAVTSCEHKDLCYEHPHPAEIKVVFDWHKAPGAIPESMCAYLLPVSGEEPVTRNFAASLFRNIKYFTLRKLYLCRKWMQKRLQKTTTTGITLPNFDFLA